MTLLKSMVHLLTNSYFAATRKPLADAELLALLLEGEIFLSHCLLQRNDDVLFFSLPYRFPDSYWRLGKQTSPDIGKDRERSEPKNFV